MSTLVTRIAGYKFQIDTHPTAGANGAFVAEAGGFMALPYELRSTYHQSEGQTIGILAAAFGAVAELRDRVNETEAHHQYDSRDCGCAACTISLRIYERENVTGRSIARKYGRTAPKPESYVDVTYSRRTGRRAGYAWQNI